MTPEPPPDLRRSSRSSELVRSGLLRSVVAHLGEGEGHRINALAGTSAANGLSSETLLFDLSWEEDGGSRTASLVARVAPDPVDVPVFPRYDLPGQFRTIADVAAVTDVPVPPLWFCEDDPAVIGSPFFVMEKVDGEIPPDVMPYNFGDSWLSRATPDQQRNLEESSVSVLARLHDVDQPDRRFAHLSGGSPGRSPLRAHVDRTIDHYRFASADSGASPVVERGLQWLEDHWPRHETPSALCWGDARIGNVVYRGFVPVAVLDWEMACIGPPELDVAWMVTLHRIFEDLAHDYSLPGMPDFLRPDGVASHYERLSGRSPRDLDWYTAYAAVQMGVVFLRIGWRQVVFGDRPAPECADELLVHRSTLESLTG